MAVRLIEMRRVLKPTGSIYLHCDDTASHYLKVCMDCIFGEGNFRNEITWKRTTSRTNEGGFGRLADTLLCYSKGKKRTFHQQYGPYTEQYLHSKYRASDEHGRYRLDNLTVPGGDKNKYRIPSNLPAWFKRPNGWETLDFTTRWDALVNSGLIVQKTGRKPQFKRYLSTGKGVAVGNIWTDITVINSQAKESCGYPTQKPLTLLKRIILASSNEGDLVLDPFCGCATACVAAEDTGRQWIGIDISPLAAELVERRFKDELGLISPKIIHRTDVPQREGKRSKDIKHFLYGQQEGLCTGCEHYFLFRNFTVDHIVPKSKGGPDSDDNLQLLCGACNSLKGNRKSMPELKAELRRQNILRAA